MSATQIAIGQLVWFVTGIGTGAVLMCCLAVWRGWFDRKITLAPPPIDIDWVKLSPGISEALGQIKFRPTILVDWTIIQGAVEREGYIMVAKPSGAENVAQKH